MGSIGVPKPDLVLCETRTKSCYLEFLAPTVSTTVTPTPTLSIPTGYSQIFLDNFDGSSLNTLVWKPYNNNYGSGNKEEECNTPNNVTVSNGSLLITAKRENIVCPGTSTNYSFTSAFLGTRENNTYFPKFARYEMRAKLPHAQGLWPAFWLRHRNGSTNPLGAEVDVMEYFHSQVPGKTSSTLHLDGTSNVAKKTVAFETPTTTPGWHTWAVETKPDMIDTTKVNFSFTLDGTEFFNITPSQKAWATDATNGVDPNHMFDIAINMAVGGNYVGHPDDELGWSRYLNKCLKPYGGAAPCDGTGILRASFPSTYEVDYVRVLTKN
jgi:beta-glucanase (GH16 family)